MFYKVHNTMEDVGIRVTSVQGKSLKRPTYFEDANYKHSKKVSAYHAIQKFGRAATAAKKQGLRAGRLPPSVLKARQQFEAAWLRKAQVQYELVHRRWNPYERIHAKKFQQQKVLYSFESKKWSDH